MVYLNRSEGFVMRRQNNDDDFDISVDEPIFTTGVICRILDIPIWVLKQLDKEGIVSPPRTKGQIRLYSKREVVRVKHCWSYMHKYHVKIQGLKVILKMENGTFQGEV